MTPPADKRVCWGCVAEDYVSARIKKAGKSGSCDYCGKKRRTVSTAHVADLVERAIEDHYERTSENPEGYEYYLQREGYWERAGDPIDELIEGLLETSQEIAEDVRELLDDRTTSWDGVQAGEEQPYSSEAQYERVTSIRPSKLGEEYRRFEKALIEESRYFSPSSRQSLGALFGGLDGLTTHDGLPVIESVGPGHKLRSFFRARVFQDDRQLQQAMIDPESELGPPPRRMGRAGRLNAAGVSIFYGADTVETAIAEVRPPVGSRVLSASFEVVRPIRLLDIEALKSILVKGSLFDPEHRGRLEHAAFLESFSSRFSQPVMPGHEAFEYVPTQAVADFIANEVSPAVDGILYRSPQTGGRNVALFHRSSEVEQRTRVVGSETSVMFGHQTEDGYETEYTVFETAPSLNKDAARVPDQKHKQREDFFSAPDEAKQEPGATLRIVLDTLTVYAIPKIEIKSTPYPVARINFGSNGRQEDF